MVEPVNPNVMSVPAKEHISPVFTSLLVAFVALVIGVLAGYYVAIQQSISQSAQNQNKTVNNQNADNNEDAVLNNMERITNDARNKWGTLLDEYQLQFLVKGTITKIDILESGNKAGYAEITLKNQNNEVKFTVFKDTVYRAGDYLNYTSWVEIQPSDLKAGDTVTIATAAQVNSESNAGTFYGNLVFKHN